jgi:hypothetical protein
MDMKRAFYSSVLVLDEFDDKVAKEIAYLSDLFESEVEEFEQVLIWNGKNSVQKQNLEKLVSSGQVKNLKLIVLLSKVDPDIAATAGMELALGDYVLVSQAAELSQSGILSAIKLSDNGHDAVVAGYPARTYSLAYRFFRSVFLVTYRMFSGLDVSSDIGQTRLLSKRLINFILSQNAPHVAYRSLSTIRGFDVIHEIIQTEKLAHRKTNLFASIKRGFRVLFTTSIWPLRSAGIILVISSLFSVGYSVFVLTVAATDNLIERGWASLSLQISASFFLTSVVLLLITEHLVQNSKSASGSVRYYITEVLVSPTTSLLSRLNIRTTSEPFTHD